MVTRTLLFLFPTAWDQDQDQDAQVTISGVVGGDTGRT